MTVTQPGLAPYSVRLVKSTTTKFAATFKLKSGGTPGTVPIRISGSDTKGGVDTRFFFLTVTFVSPIIK